MTTNITNNAHLSSETVLNKAVLAMAIMSNVPEICGAYYKDLPIALLEPHPTIQRNLVPDHYGSIAADWDITKCAPLTVSLQDDGTFFIIDGQHRYMAATIVGATTLPCRIFRNMNPKSEAEAFYKQNENNKRLTPRDTLRARLFVNEPIAVALEKLCQKHEIHLFKNTNLDKPWLRALSDVEIILHIEGAKVVDEIFTFIESAGWHDERLGYSKDVILAAYRFRRHATNKKYGLQDVAKELLGYDLDSIIDFAKTNCIGKTRATCLYNFFIEVATDADCVKNMMDE